MKSAAIRSDTWRIIAVLVAGLAAGVLLSGSLVNGQAQKLERISENLYFGVQRGMIVPYCGIELPDGFVWADGNSNWPNEPWVPKHLRGKPVPDMNHRLIGGVNPDSDDVGALWNRGQIQLPPMKVGAGKFTLPAKRKKETVFSDTDRDPFPRGPWVVVQRAGDRYDGKNGYYWRANACELDMREGRYETFSAAAAIEGETDLKFEPIELKGETTNPSYIQVPWVIRLK